MGVTIRLQYIAENDHHTSPCISPPVCEDSQWCLTEWIMFTSTVSCPCGIKGSYLSVYLVVDTTL